MSWAEIKKAVNSDLSVPLNEYHFDNINFLSTYYVFSPSTDNRVIAEITGKGFISAVYFKFDGLYATSPTGSSFIVDRTYKILVDDEIWDNHKLTIRIATSSSNCQTGYGFAIGDVTDDRKTYLMIPKGNSVQVNYMGGGFIWDYPLCRVDTPREDASWYMLTGSGTGYLSKLPSPIKFNKSFKFIGVHDDFGSSLSSVLQQEGKLYIIYTLVE